MAAGLCRLAYDFGLYAMFVNMRLDKHEQDDSVKTRNAATSKRPIASKGSFQKLVAHQSYERSPLRDCIEENYQSPKRPRLDTPNISISSLIKGVSPCSFLVFILYLRMFIAVSPFIPSQTCNLTIQWRTN